jgi:hypothetical protein
VNPLQVLAALVSEAHADALEHRFGRKTLEAFEEMHERGRVLTDKQEIWVMDVGEKMGIFTAPGANLFSKLSSKEQARQRSQAQGILPWEKK